jgi:hypothetical protein
MKKILLLLFIAFAVKAQSQMLTVAQVYDFMPGDVFQYNYTDVYDMGISCYYPAVTTKNTDSIVSRTSSAAGDTIFYTVSWTQYRAYGCTPVTPPYYASGTSIRYYTNLSAPALDTADQTCNPDVDSFYVAYCGRNVWNRSNPNDNCFENTAWNYEAIEGCGIYGSYRGGYGGEPHYYTTLIYYKKGSASCGTYSISGIDERTVSAELSLYPNPNDGDMEFSYSISGASSGELLIFDLSGKVISKYELQEGTNRQLRINLSGLSNGVYFYRMMVENEMRASDKLVIIK